MSARTHRRALFRDFVARCAPLAAPAAGLILGLFLATPHAQATRKSTHPGGVVRPEPHLAPFFHAGYVREAKAPGAKQRIVATDMQYANDLLASVDTGFDAFDIVMQQCYSGSFINDVDAALIAYTIATACDWYETAWGGGVFAGPLTDNFSRAWYQSTDFMGAGIGPMVEIFDEAVDAVGVPKDPYAPPTAFPGFEEHPQYSSPDDPLGPNDGRTIGVDDQFAILVAWDDADPRHLVNLQRMHAMLLRRGVPAGHIVVLLGNPAPAAIAPWAVMLPTEPAGLAGIPINGANTRANWLAALAGVGFAMPPEIGDQLFIFNTGHGGHAISVPLLGILIPFPGGGGGAGPGTMVKIGLHERFVVRGAQAGLDVPDVTGADGLDVVQITFNAPVPECVDLVINETSFGPLADFAIPEEESLGLEPFIESEQHHYQVQVPHDLLCTDPPGCENPEAEITFLNLDPSLIHETKLLAVLFKGGDQEFLAKITEHEAVSVCPGDLNLDGIVNSADLFTLLGDWGPQGANGDLDGSCAIDGDDLAVLLGAWGPCS
jgi:hypothetical protein